MQANIKAGHQPADIPVRAERRPDLRGSTWFMRHDLSSELIELTEEVSSLDGVRFDPNSVTLEGLYGDEVSAYRAKKTWLETLKASFLLEPGHDFELSVAHDEGAERYILACAFKTACARYAFWRLTNHQAPEAQYQIETGHIPQCDSREADFLRAPDMRPKCWDYEPPFVDHPGKTMVKLERRSLIRLARTLINDLAKSMRRP